MSVANVMPAAGRRDPKRKRLTKRLRDEFEPFYADHTQAKETNFWPSVGLMVKKGRVAVKPLLPVGMNVIDPSVGNVQWVEPNIANDSLVDWIRNACNANAALILSEFKQENLIRSRLGNGDFDIYLHEHGDVLAVKASIFFGSNVVRFGSWSLYCKLLTYMSDNDFHLDAIPGAVDWSKRSHVLMFVSSYLPLSYLAAKYDDDDPENATTMAHAIIECMDMFTIIRDTLFGLNRVDGITPDDGLGDMIINMDNNSITRLQETLRLSDAAGVVCEDVPDYMWHLLEASHHDFINPRVLLDLLKFKERVKPIRSFVVAQRERNSAAVVAPNFNVINIKESDLLTGIEHIVDSVYGVADIEDGDDLVADFQIPIAYFDVSFHVRDEMGGINHFEMDRLAHAVCLLQLVCGSRYVGVLLFNKIEQLGVYLETNGMRRNDYDTLNDSEKQIARMGGNAWDLMAITNLSKQKAEGSLRWLLPNILDSVPDGEVGMRPYIFLALLAAVRYAIYELFPVDIEWHEYTTRVITLQSIHDPEDMPEVTIKYIENRDENTLAVRQMKSFFYSRVNAVTKNLRIDGMEAGGITTHDLRRLYCAYAYASYADQNSITKTEFIRATLSHQSDASRHYTMISVILDDDDDDDDDDEAIPESDIPHIDEFPVIDMPDEF